jgi:phosphoribosylformylglycinamidine synthase
MYYLAFSILPSGGIKSGYYLCRMKFKADINIMPHKELLDPQGKTVARNMDHVGITGIEDVRIGKHIEILLDATDEAAAKAVIELACQKLLANMIMESYSFEIKAA